MGVQWSFTVPEDQLTSTGYEGVAADIYDLAIQYKTDASDTQQDGDTIVARIADLVETVGYFPITYFSLRGAQAEILKCLETDAKYGFGRESNVVSAGQSTAGVDLCKWAFPHLHATAAKAEGVSLWKKFHNRAYLEKAIRWACNGIRLGQVKKEISAGWLYAGLRGGGAAPTNFPPMAAKAIFEKFTPMNGVIWDPSAGFGGRLLGALTSPNGYTYIGTDPDPDTCRCQKRLGAIIESVTGRPYSFRVYTTGSEDYTERNEDVDFVFTSPPYFDLEDYGREGDLEAYKRQSHVKYPTREEWADGYLRGTARNICRALKPGAWCVINVADNADVKNDEGDPLDYVDDWVEISEEEGLRLRGRGSFAIQARPGSEYQKVGHLDDLARRVKGRRREPMLIFQKS